MFIVVLVLSESALADPSAYTSSLDVNEALRRALDVTYAYRTSQLLADYRNSSTVSAAWEPAACASRKQ